MPALFLSRRFSAGLLLFLGAALAAPAASRWRTRVVATNNLVRGYAAQPLATDNMLRPEERTFLEKAAAISREQGQLARLGVSQAVNSELRTFAQQLATDQRSISDAVEGLRRKKGALTENTVAPEILTEVYQKLATQTGVEFDRAFVQALGDAYTAVIGIFEQAASEIKDPDVRELAANQLPTLRAHHNQLVALRKAIE